MKSAKNSYDQLLTYQKKTATLVSCASVLGWDRETYMPAKGIHHRVEQLSLISGMAHERDIDPKIAEWLSDLEDSDLVDNPLSVEAVNVREWRCAYDKNIKIPITWVEEFSKTTSHGHTAWIESREKSDFSIFSPWLARIVKLRREYADMIGYRQARYDALLDDYEPGMTTEKVAVMFSSLRDELVPLIQSIMTAVKKPDPAILTGNYAIDKQRTIGEAAARMIGFDFGAGRLDTVVHPFCTGIGPGDTRITTRWDGKQFSSAFFGILHEAGHGIYDQGLPADHWGTPMGVSVSLGIHESQSRLWENIIGRSRPFWTFFYPSVQKSFPEQLESVSLEQYLFAINEVRPSFIRVEADEATYTLHILLRFEIEKALISGDIETDDVPELWETTFEDLLGLKLTDIADGCLQDVHWSYGGFGYFPTYALGNLYAAQFYAQATNDIPDIEQSFSAGDFSAILGWLRDKIHSHGMRYRAADLVEQVTGKPPDHRYFLAYLKEKFGNLYEL